MMLHFFNHNESALGENDWKINEENYLNISVQTKANRNGLIFIYMLVK